MTIDKTGHPLRVGYYVRVERDPEWRGWVSAIDGEQLSLLSIQGRYPNPKVKNRAALVTDCVVVPPKASAQKLRALVSDAMSACTARCHTARRVTR